MALGGGIFKTMNKVLPGSYLNFVSAKAGALGLSERGILALPISLDWGKDGITEVDADLFADMALEVFGYPANHLALRGIREALKHAKKAYVYRLNGGAGAVAASNALATAKSKGLRGNDLHTHVQRNADVTTAFDVAVYAEKRHLLFRQKAVAQVADLKANPYVDWKLSASLSEGHSDLTGGKNDDAFGLSKLNEALVAFESVGFHVLAGPSLGIDGAGALYTAYVTRRREADGAKFVLATNASDGEKNSEAVAFVPTSLYADQAEDVPSQRFSDELLYWVAGAMAACPLNRSLTNQAYDGELRFVQPINQTQRQLTEAIKAGHLLFHKVGSEMKILSDINSLTSFTPEKGEAFAKNQTIRILDQVATDIARLFNDRYLGLVPNDHAGRTSLWSDIVGLLKKLQGERAIEGFQSEHVEVKAGKTKTSVQVSLQMTPVTAMEQLYMTVVVG